MLLQFKQKSQNLYLILEKSTSAHEDKLETKGRQRTPLSLRHCTDSISLNQGSFFLTDSNKIDGLELN